MNKPARIFKDLAKNNFPKSAIFRDGSVVPSRQIIIKQNSHGFEEICGAFFTRRINPRQNINRHIFTSDDIINLSLDVSCLIKPFHLARELTLDMATIRQLGDNYPA
ncbi:MAG: hypothetical protein QX199_12620 [Methylococcaceae bacterium]